MRAAFYERAGPPREALTLGELPDPEPGPVKNVLVRFFIVYNLTPEDRARAVADLTRLLEADALTHNISARLPLARIAEARELVEDGRAAWNVVLEVG